MILVEKQIVNRTEEFNAMFKQSKALYNMWNYIMRQWFKYHYWWLLYRDCDKKYRKLFKKKMIWYYDLEKVLDSRLSSSARQQILRLLDKDWKSFYALKWVQNNRWLPWFKQKEFMLIFPWQRLTKNILLPRTLNYKINTDKIIKELKVVPVSRRKMELIISYEVDDVELKKSWISCWVDLWLNNLATIVTEKWKSLIVNWKPLKSLNKYFNKKIAKLQSKWQTHRKEQYPKNKVRRLHRKRNNKINDYLHKASKKVVDFCKENNVKEIVVWKNTWWKQECKMKNFVQIPHNRLIEMIKYKSIRNWINPVITEESYTSKIDHLVLEPMNKQEKYLWNRKYRWLFISSLWKTLNADVNWAIWILRKVSGESFIKKITSNGFVFNPVKVNID